MSEKRNLDEQSVSTETAEPTQPQPNGEKGAQDTVRNLSEKIRGAKRWQIVLGVIALVVVVGGASFWVWHEQPGFCSTMCHTSMASYVETYEQQAGATGVDKWGNAVENTNGMMSVVHREQGESCLGCHEPTLPEQIYELGLTVTGKYEHPLEEADLAQLTSWTGGDQDGFCLRSGCHVTASGEDLTTREQLIEQTADRDHNPHAEQHGQFACSDCHKSHRASVYYCTKCHADVEVPEGWLTYTESRTVVGVA